MHAWRTDKFSLKGEHARRWLASNRAHLSGRQTAAVERAGKALVLAVGQHLRSLIPGAEDGLPATSAVVVIVTALMGVMAAWLASRRIACLEIADVLRAEGAE